MLPCSVCYILIFFLLNLKKIHLSWYQSFANCHIYFKLGICSLLNTICLVFSQLHPLANNNATICHIGHKLTCSKTMKDSYMRKHPQNTAVNVFDFYFIESGTHVASKCFSLENFSNFMHNSKSCPLEGSITLTIAELRLRKKPDEVSCPFFVCACERVCCKLTECVYLYVSVHTCVLAHLCVFACRL